MPVTCLKTLLSLPYNTMHHHTTLYITVQYYTLLVNTIHYCSILYITIQHYTTLYTAIQHYTLLYNTHYTQPYYTIHNHITQYTTVQHHTLLFISLLLFLYLYIFSTLQSNCINADVKKNNIKKQLTGYACSSFASAALKLLTIGASMTGSSNKFKSFTVIVKKLYFEVLLMKCLGCSDLVTWVGFINSLWRTQTLENNPNTINTNTINKRQPYSLLYNTIYYYTTLHSTKQHTKVN